MSARRVRRLIGFLAAVAVAIVVAVPPGAAQEGSCDDVDSSPCDLAVTAASALESADQVRVDVTVRNIGERASTETELTVSAENWAPYTTTVGPIEGGGASEFNPLFDIPESARGTQAVFRVEVRAVPDEGSEGPNITRTSIEIPATPPDLVLATAVARVIDAGDRVEIEGVIRNLGASTAEEVTITASAPGWEDEQATLEEGIEQQGSRPFSLVLDTPDDQRGTSVRFHVAVDPVVDETQTDNNELDTNVVEIPAAPTPKPDLAVTRAQARIVDGGRSVEITGLIENRGDTTTEDVTVGVAAPEWDSESTSLPGGIEQSATRPFTILLAVPAGDRTGTEVSFHVEVDPVDGEENLVNNARDTAPIVVPIVEGADGGNGLLWPLVLGGAALLVAAAITAWQLARRRRMPAEAVPPASALPPRSERAVSTGFSSESDAGTPLPPDRPLAPSTPYLFWLEIGPPVAGSIEETPTDLPAGVPTGATLTVALFSLDEDLVAVPAADVGELRLEPDGSVTVSQPAAIGVSAGSGLDLRRLFIRVRTGAAPGTARLRCNIYFKHVLVQARLITAELRTIPEAIEGALRSRLDYTLAPALDPERLAKLEPHRLSVLVNESADGSHDFYFLGEQEFKSQASFDGQELQNLITRARGALKRAAWGDPDEWASGKAYRYEGFDLERLEGDLIRLALGGYRFYDTIINRLAGGREQVTPLEALMLAPGLVQIASRESPRHVIPAALIYDYPLDTTARLEEYELCSTFLAALQQRQPLAETACFRGSCPHREAATIVCPSGFWGYRHILGMPVSVGGSAPDLPTEIPFSDGPHLVVAVSTDPAFVLRPGHEEVLRGLRSGLGWFYADTRERAIALLKEGKAEVVYFYCHGGVLDDIPFIQVGATNERGITRDLLRRESIEWTSPRPLVFINGCHTTALEPEKAIEFVSALVENARASGVIGTEITVFEPLASVFAEECLRGFLDGEPIGAAVRNARLTLLAAGNPLGLAYIPFVMATLRLRAS